MLSFIRGIAKIEEASISERVKLVSTNDVLERLQGKRAIGTLDEEEE
ncbi:MAG: hypothetical protein ACFFG0_15160 [Candidatus Thorarchaeota archaeon]